MEAKKDNVATVSVIIPTYNRASMLKEAVESVLGQTYSDYEIIVVDDGSTDNTRDILDEMCARMPSIRYVYQRNTGRSAARNHALRLAGGKYIAFLDSDDLFLPQKLERQVACLDELAEYGMVYSSAVCIGENGDELPTVYGATASGWIYAGVAFLVPVPVLLPTVMIRAEVMSEVGGFDEKMERFEDTDMWRRVSRHCRILAIPEILCKVRTHSENELDRQDPEAIYEAVTRYVSKVFEEDGDQSQSFLRQGAARLYFHYGRGIMGRSTWHAVGRRFILRAVRYWPPKAFEYVFLIAILRGISIKKLLRGICQSVHSLVTGSAASSDSTREKN